MSKTQATTQPPKPTSASVSGSNVTTTVVTAANITGLTLPVEANKKYIITGSLKIGCDNTGGMNFTLTAPSGAALLMGTYIGSSTSSGAGMGGNQLALGTLTTGGFCRVNTNIGWVALTIYITTGSTAGNIQLQYASVVNAQTSTIYIGSTISVIETK